MTLSRRTFLKSLLGLGVLLTGSSVSALTQLSGSAKTAASVQPPTQPLMEVVENFHFIEVSELPLSTSPLVEGIMPSEATLSDEAAFDEGFRENYVEERYVGGGYVNYVNPGR